LILIKYYYEKPPCIKYEKLSDCEDHMVTPKDTLPLDRILNRWFFEVRGGDIFKK
jgi:hypothetical protein